MAFATRWGERYFGGGIALIDRREVLTGATQVDLEIAVDRRIFRMRPEV